MKKEIIDLNLIMSYPVKWNIYKILRDFIQNFYDSVSYKEFDKRFSYKYEDETLEIRCSDVAYSYEYLLHIGASSKTESEKNTAGYFGEGFKVAALCAIRDYNLNIEVMSSNWYINVIENKIFIDGIPKKSLAYELQKYDIKSNDSVLRIRNFKERYMEVFYSALYSFYYEENPLLGKKIYSDDLCAIYERSSMEKICCYPSSYNSSGEGITFAGYMARGSLKEPLVFAYHDYKDNDRDRNFFSDIDNIDIIVKCARSIDSQTAMKLLIMYKKLWYSYPKGKYGYNSYYTVIKNLIFRMINDNQCVEKFRNMYPNLLYACRNSDMSKREINERKYCLAWIKENPQYTLVQDSFRYISVQCLEDKCRAENILPEISVPKHKEKDYINILEECTREIFKDFLKTDELPICNVIRNVNSSVSGYASTTKYKKIDKNKYGYRFRLKIESICIKEKYLSREYFISALTVYIHELFHTFGGDKSESFSYAMTDAVTFVLLNVDLIEKYKRLWLEI